MSLRQDCHIALFGMFCKNSLVYDQIQRNLMHRINEKEMRPVSISEAYFQCHQCGNTPCLPSLTSFSIMTKILMKTNKENIWENKKQMKVLSQLKERSVHFLQTNKLHCTWKPCIKCQYFPCIFVTRLLYIQTLLLCITEVIFYTNRICSLPEWAHERRTLHHMLRKPVASHELM